MSGAARVTIPSAGARMVGVQLLGILGFASPELHEPSWSSSATNASRHESAFTPDGIMIRPSRAQQVW
jgi:hypothetical protein